MARATVGLPLHRMRARARQVGRPLRGVRRVECGGGGADAPARAERRRPGGAAAGTARPSDRPPARLRDVATEPLARWRTGLPEFDFVLGGGIVPGLDGPDRRRARDRQVHPAAPGRGPARGAAAARCSTPAAKSRPTRSGSAPTAWPRTPARCTCWARPGSRPSSTRPTAVRADVVVLDSIQTVYTETLESAPGNVGPGPGVLGPAHALRQGERHGGRGRGARHQGRRHRRAQDARAHRRHGALLRGRGDARLPPAPRHQEPLRLGGRARRVLHDGAAASWRCPILRRSSWPRGPPASAAARSPRSWRAPARCWSRSRRWRRKSGYGTPQRVATGLDPKRLAVLLAVLERRAETSFADLDVFVQVTAGVRLTEPGADLAVAAALLSSLYNRPAPADVIFLGEIGLGGEIRPIGALERRLAEAARLGFRRVFGSSRSAAAGPGRVARRARPRRAAGARPCRVTSASSWSPAGQGTRVGGETPKQFRPIARRARCCFARSGRSRRIPTSPGRRVLPAADAARPPPWLRGADRRRRWPSSPAGPSARDSVAAGLAALPADCADRAGARCAPGRSSSARSSTP